MNVTPLVDVVLVLLIIFMVIAPALNEGEHIELPSIFQPDPKPKDMNPIDVAMAYGGKYLVDKQVLDESGVRPLLVKLHAADPERNVMLKTDERIPYKKVRENLAMLQKIGFPGVSLKVMERKAGGGAS
ncbi:MAG: biopolymer transporter ExbD [Polyangiaceae bacterium]|nr:biopolymer transporter ExbD [Polyangiaceae bacterium]